MSYNLLNPVKVIAAGDMSLTSLTSQVVEIKNQDNIGVQLNWTGSPTGTFSFQVSMDHKEDLKGNVEVAGNWIPLVPSPIPSATGTAGNAYIDFNQISAPYFRIVYTKTSGTGSLAAFVNGKGV